MGRLDRLHPNFLAGALGLGTVVYDPGAHTDLCAKLACGAVVGCISYATNLLASRRDAMENARPLSAEEVGVNHHLARLAGYALRTIVEAEAQGHAEGSPGRLALARAAERAEADWLVVLKAPSGEDYRRVDSARLADVAAGQAFAPGSVLVLDARAWLPYARFILQRPGDPAQTAGLEGILAARFEQDFAAHFHEHAKSSLEKDPPAFAALLLQFHAELRFTQREHSAELAAVRLRLDTLVAKLDEQASLAARAPGFDWTRLTLHLAESESAHAEFRAFFQRHGQLWDELLSQVCETLTLLREVHGPQHRQILSSLAGLNLLLNDQVLPLIREVQRGERDRFSGASIILELLRAQRASDDEARRRFDDFLSQREAIQGRGGHHYYQPENWSPGHRTRKLWREAGAVFVPRPPLLQPDEVPPRGTNLYFWGESGHGKSLLAANIADRLLARGYRALTFNLRQAGDILRHLALLTDKEWLGLDAPRGSAQREWPDATARIVAACTWLLEDRVPDDPFHPPFCLVWDNADDLVTLDHLFRLQLLHHRGVQIITSRISPDDLVFEAEHPCHDWPPRRLTVRRVRAYDEAEARRHIEQTIAGGEGETATPVEGELDRLLRGASLAGDSAHFDPLKLHDLLVRLRKSGWNFDEVLGPKPPPVAVVRGEEGIEPAPAPAERSHAEVLGQTIAALPPLARIAWRLLVHLAPAPIPEDFWGKMESFLRDAEDLPEAERADIGTALRGRLPLVQARSALAEAELLTGGDEGDLVHARHHALGRTLLPASERLATYRLALLFLRHVMPQGNPHDDVVIWPYYHAAEAHLLAVLGPERVPAILSLRETGWLTHRFNKYLITQFRLAEAHAIGKLDLGNSVAVDGLGSQNHGTSLHELARVQLAQGRYAEAEAGFTRALEIYRQHHGESHPRFATTLHELARAQLVQGRYAEAEAGFRQALEIHRQHHGESHPSFANTLHALARLQLEQGRYAEAEAGFRQAVGIYGQLKGEASWEAAMARGDLAAVLWKADRVEDATALFEQAQRELAGVLTPDHLRVARLLHHWAECELGEIPTTGPLVSVPLAQQRVERVLEIRREHLGVNHPDTAATQLLRAECRRRQNDLVRAREDAATAAPILAASFHSEHRLNKRAQALLASLPQKSGADSALGGHAPGQTERC